ncbi:GPCR, rhodopsin-like, 7TM domain-containing protein [Strongyloides ratti]|uniref:GPCR, rhodopsin-like, 7TM domain-containing protein n=1 Tax=Strongyloides ratti TaxID=34506 RepID=A0A090MRK4_STRRB|nr:GPCR, rhodopsin-like, 7TM domain-containing protein [Strongyloides ratti]CEF60858.1 GPCR, rhodopsin-like, 7TM domain-containing protein [Strongyloides ratti]
MEENISFISDSNITFISEDEYYMEFDYTTEVISNGTYYNLELQKIANYIIACSSYAYVFFAAIGLILNAYVITRLIQFALSDYDRFKRGCGFPLAVMSLSDLISILGIIGNVSASLMAKFEWIQTPTHSISCKIIMYVLHTMTSFSTWCWLFVSAIRYMAVYHPLWQSTRWALGDLALYGILAISMSLNFWLLIVVNSSYFMCAEIPLSKNVDFNRIFHIIEFLWSYVLPAALTLFMDIRVIFTKPPGFIEQFQYDKKKCKKTTFLRLSSRKSLESPKFLGDVVRKNQANKRTTMKKARCNVWRFLLIVTINQLLNAPDNVFKMMAIIGGTGYTGDNRSLIIHTIALIGRLMYFSQFCFNAAILSIIVYNHTTRPRKMLTYAEQFKKSTLNGCEKISHEYYNLSHEKVESQSGIGMGSSLFNDEKLSNRRGSLKKVKRTSSCAFKLTDLNKFHIKNEVNYNDDNKNYLKVTESAEITLNS